MKLEFNDLSELDAFLRWADTYHTSGTREPDAPRGGVDGSVGDVAFDTPPQSATGDAADRMAPVLAAGADALTRVAESSATPERAAAEPTKRKRRTKAEIEADEKAAAEGKETAEALLRKRNNDIAAGLVHEAEAVEGAKQPEGTNPFATAETPAGEAASTPPADAQGNGAGESEVVTPFQHLTRAREFIAKHDMPKYNETFAKAGLDANVMAYSAYQRAVHVAALDEMDKA